MLTAMLESCHHDAREEGRRQGGWRERDEPPVCVRERERRRRRRRKEARRSRSDAQRKEHAALAVLRVE